MSGMKLCPFCGSEAFYIKIMGNYEKPHEIYCSKCDGAITEGRSEKQVVTNWNTRPIEDALRARAKKAEAMVERLIEVFEKGKDIRLIPDPEINKIQEWAYKLKILVTEWKEREE